MMSYPLLPPLSLLPLADPLPGEPLLVQPHPGAWPLPGGPARRGRGRGTRGPSGTTRARHEHDQGSARARPGTRPGHDLGRGFLVFDDEDNYGFDDYGF
jgi:hypothetical protein